MNELEKALSDNNKFLEIFHKSQEETKPSPINTNPQYAREVAVLTPNRVSERIRPRLIDELQQQVNSRAKSPVNSESFVNKRGKYKRIVNNNRSCNIYRG